MPPARAEVELPHVVFDRNKQNAASQDTVAV